MAISDRILELLQEWSDSTEEGDHGRALAAAREALADPDSLAIPGLRNVFQLLEQASLATQDPGLASRRRQSREEATRSSTCSFCERGSADVLQLVAGGEAHICIDCLVDSDAVLSGQERRAVAVTLLPAVDDAGHCSFCNSPNAARAAGKRTASICRECVRRIRAALGIV